MLERGQRTQDLLRHQSLPLDPNGLHLIQTGGPQTSNVDERVQCDNSPSICPIKPCLESNERVDEVGTRRWG